MLIWEQSVLERLKETYRVKLERKIEQQSACDEARRRAGIADRECDRVEQALRAFCEMIDTDFAEAIR